jgi:hypothetical protein
MRWSLIVVACTWLVAMILRACARLLVDTLENPDGVLSLPGGGLVEIPLVNTVLVLILLYVVILVWWRLRPTWLAATGLGLYVGGAAANATERFAFGAVTDYIPIPWPEPYLANFADLAMITGGVVLTGALIHGVVRRGVRGVR